MLLRRFCVSALNATLEASHCSEGSWCDRLWMATADTERNVHDPQGHMATLDLQLKCCFTKTKLDVAEDPDFRKIPYV
jgi:hypothetical protein